MERLLKAIYFANQKHKGHLRKDKETPYIYHLLSVALILALKTKDIDLIIGALLHDVIEDSNTSLDEIKNEFGSKVANIVKNCTEDYKNMAWVDRKQRAIDKIRHLDINSAKVKLADIYHNINDLCYQVDEFGVGFLENFSTSNFTKLIYERKRLNEFKKYHKSAYFIAETDSLLKKLEHEINKAV